MKMIMPFFFIIVSSHFSFAQIKKVEKSFRKGQYEKCIELAGKTARHGKNLGELTYYQCKSNFLLFISHRNNLSYLDKAVSFYPAVAKSKMNKDSDFAEVMKFELEKTADSLYKVKNQTKSKQYVRMLAATFKDTIELYVHLFPKKELIKKKEGAVITCSKPKVRVPPSRGSIIRYSETFQSVPYKWGGEDSLGFDCSGFVLKVMKLFGFVFNHGAKDQSELGFAISRNELKPGDLVFFGKKYENGRCKIDHVAIAHTVSNEVLKVIHCTSKGVNVQELKANDYWGKKILFYRNIIDESLNKNSL
jgi:hypothetical protein